ncbi:flavin containing amine oxidoreductase domain-containing protein [Phthorimaea operculella]|nr:flavin containing amine oxidoreductase domain-containing protein [Phthorimaea operculella]
MRASRGFVLALLFSADLIYGNPADSRNMPEDYDTIVVGLGAAGAVAASTLARAGKKVLALEAQDRIGGRVDTVPFGDGIVEVGAEWIHGTEGSFVYKTGIENNIDILPQDIEIQTKQSDGKEVDGNLAELLNIEEFFETGDDPGYPMPVSEVITERLMENPDVAKDTTLMGEILRYIALMIENVTAAYSWTDLNAHSPSQSLGGHQHMSWHRNGYETFFKLVLNESEGGLPGLDIKLSTVVTKIEWPKEDGEKVSVTTKDGTVYKADNVIVTVSLGVLKERYENLFSPSLPKEKVTAIEKLQMGVIAKTIISFEETWRPEKSFYTGLFWKDEDLKSIPSEDYWTTMFTAASSPMGSTNTVTLWTVGDVAKQVEVMPDELLKEKALSILRRFFGADVPEPTGILRTAWQSNEFTRGAYTYDSMTASDVPTAREDLGTPVKDASGKLRVLFAGEAVHPSQFSTVHGAAETGLKAAQSILEQ